MYFLMLIFINQAFAASSGTLVLSGVVAPVNDLVVTPNGTNNTTLNIGAGVSNLNVATVSETSNDANGYKIFMQSVTGGFLQLNPTHRTTYTVSYAGAPAVTLTTGSTQVKSVASLSTQTTASSAVTVNVVALPNALAGTYSDTITVSIVGN